MRRTAVPLLALLLCTSAAASPDPLPPWQGVWRGAVGTVVITVCLREDDARPAGVYYYARHLETIRLAAAEKSDPPAMSFIEGDGDPARKNAPRWTLQPPVANQMGGTWSGNGRNLPIRLWRVDLESADDKRSPCASGAFNDAREKPAQVVVGTADPAQAQYRTLSLDFGNRFNADIASFALTGSGAGIASVNAALRKSLLDEQENVFACSRAVLEQTGHPGEYQVATTPELISGRWLVAATASSNSCGGAHPNYDRSFSTWDLASGKAIDPWTWFMPAAAQRMVKDTAGSYTALDIQPGLRSLIDQGWIALSDGDCRDAPGTEDSIWMVRPTRTGMAFTPSLAHVVHACTDDVVIPYKRLLKWMTPAGKAAAAEISAPARAK